MMRGRWSAAAVSEGRNFASMAKVRKNVFCNPVVYKLNNKISHLIRTDRIEDARAVFDKAARKNTVTWNSMIDGYVKAGSMNDARKLFDEMPRRDVVSWNSMIYGYVSFSGTAFLDEGRRLFDTMPERDCISWNTMINGYGKNGRMDDALFLFNQMPCKNDATWNALITGFLRNGNLVRAFEYFEMMPEKNAWSLSAFVSGLIHAGELDVAASFLLQWRTTNKKTEDLIPAYNTLIAGYGKHGIVDEARKLFDEMPDDDGQGKKHEGFKRNLVSWNTMIMCYVRAGDVSSARELFDQMVIRDYFSWNTMISGYVHVLDLEEASVLFESMPNRVARSWNMMIAGFSQVGSLARAHDLFDKMPHKDLVSWNSLIAGYDRNGEQRQAVKLFMEMQAEGGERPDKHTLSSILSVSAGTVDLQLGRQVHQLVVKTIRPDMPICNALITMYAKCGAIGTAWTIFDENKMQKDVVSWNAMIGGCSFHGYASEALQLFYLMARFRVKPTFVTFVSVLNACAHAGLIDEGREVFESMVSEHGIVPRIEHYTSMVDIIGRHGNLVEALDLIKSMPYEPDATIWGALLGASSLHNNVEVARVAADAMIRLQPDTSSPYVLLRNLHASAGNWDRATELRLHMDKKNIKKQAGFSWIDSS